MLRPSRVWGQYHHSHQNLEPNRNHQLDLWEAEFLRVGFAWNRCLWKLPWPWSFYCEECQSKGYAISWIRRSNQRHLNHSTFLLIHSISISQRFLDRVAGHHWQIWMQLRQIPPRSGYQSRPRKFLMKPSTICSTTPLHPWSDSLDIPYAYLRH